jgi:hypothetical protein
VTNPNSWPICGIQRARISFRDMLSTVRPETVRRAAAAHSPSDLDMCPGVSDEDATSYVPIARGLRLLDADFFLPRAVRPAVNPVDALKHIRYRASLPATQFTAYCVQPWLAYGRAVLPRGLVPCSLLSSSKVSQCLFCPACSCCGFACLHAHMHTV